MEASCSDQFKRYCLVLFSDGAMMVRSSWMMLDDDNIFCRLPPPKVHRIMLKTMTNAPLEWKIHAVIEIIDQSDDMVLLKKKEKKWEEKGTVSDTDTEAKRKHIPVSKYGHDQTTAVQTERPAKRHCALPQSIEKHDMEQSQVDIDKSSDHGEQFDEGPVTSAGVQHLKQKVACFGHCRHVEQWFQKLFLENEIIKDMIRNSAGLSNVESESTNLMLPVKDIGELFQLAERLDESRQIKEEFKRCVNYVVVETKNSTKNIKAILQKIAPADIWAQFNLTGKGKLEFPKSLLMNIIHIMESHKQYRRESIPSKVSQVLKHMKQVAERSSV